MEQLLIEDYSIQAAGYWGTFTGSTVGGYFGKLAGGAVGEEAGAFVGSVGFLGGPELGIITTLSGAAVGTDVGSTVGSVLGAGIGGWIGDHL